MQLWVILEAILGESAIESVISSRNTMNLQRWIGRRQPTWDTLASLLKQVEKRGLKSLNATQIQQLASLYRSAAADLARAQTHALGDVLLQNLHNLTSRSYSQIYQGSRSQEWQNAWQFYQTGFPQVVQATFPYTLVSTAIFAVSGLVAWWFAWQDPAFMAALVPPDLIHLVRDKGELWMGSILGWQPVASSSIMINNMTVAFQVVGGGITAGLFTVYALIFNGFSIGAIAALVSQNNLAYPFWAFVFPHGALELPAIFLAGGAGLLIARSLVFPGQLRRADALKHYGSQAVQLVYGIVPMLFIAGLLEGFVSPSPQVPSEIKYLLGVLLFIGLIAYCRRRSP